jgi:hypothetical protein
MVLVVKSIFDIMYTFVNFTLLTLPTRIILIYVITIIYLLNENILNEDSLSRWQTNLEIYTILYKIFILFSMALKRNWHSD